MANTKTTTPINLHKKIKQLIKQNLDPYPPYGEYQLNCVDQIGYKIKAQVNTVQNLITTINDWRRHGFRKIQVFELPKYGVPQFWQVEETSLR